MLQLTARKSTQLDGEAKHQGLRLSEPKQVKKDVLGSSQV